MGRQTGRDTPRCSCIVSPYENDQRRYLGRGVLVEVELFWLSSKQVEIAFTGPGHASPKDQTPESPRARQHGVKVLEIWLVPPRWLAY
jgi:hypothetical protein